MASELYKALALAQADADNATKGSVNPHLKNRYADLGAVLEAAKPVLARHGLAVVTLPATSEGQDAAFVTTLYHASGEHVSTSLTIPYGAKRDAQGLGGMLTYARRYCLSAWLNMWAEDDDGESAVGRTGKPASVTPAPGRTVKELVEALTNAPSVAALDSLLPECQPYRDTKDWASIAAVAKSTKERLLKEAK